MKLNAVCDHTADGPDFFMSYLNQMIFSPPKEVLQSPRKGAHILRVDTIFSTISIELQHFLVD